MEVKRHTIAVGAVLSLAACGDGRPEPHRVPDVREERLDIAEARLRDRGLEWEELGGGVLGILVRSNWQVCDQDPRPGTKARTVQLIVERDCYDDWDDD